MSSTWQNSELTRELEDDLGAGLFLDSTGWRSHTSITTTTGGRTELVDGQTAGTVRTLPTSAGAISIVTTADSGIVLISYVNEQGYERQTTLTWSGAQTVSTTGISAIRVTRAGVLGGLETLSADINVRIGGVSVGKILADSGWMRSASFTIPRGQQYDLRAFIPMADRAADFEFEIEYSLLRPTGTEEAPFATLTKVSLKMLDTPLRAPIPFEKFCPPLELAFFDPAWQYPGEAAPGWYVTGPVDIRAYANGPAQGRAGLSMRGRKWITIGADADPNPELIPWRAALLKAEQQRRISRV